MESLQTRIDELIELLTSYRKLLGAGDLTADVATYDIRQLLDTFVELL